MENAAEHSFSPSSIVSHLIPSDNVFLSLPLSPTHLSLQQALHLQIACVLFIGLNV